MITQDSLIKEHGRIKSLEVLLAEDNVINQKLAIRLLEKRGHHAVVVSNGKEALVALETNVFDLVLMDVQMPEMDGLEATTRLREKEKMTGRHQQVVAMTALAMKGDRERCLAAGMDDYLSKPIRTPELDEILERYVAHKEQAVTRSEQQHLHPSSESVNVEELLERIGGDLAFLVELLDLFREDYPKQLRTARAALAANDSIGVHQAGHAMRGALANLSATTACNLARQIESMGQAGDLVLLESVLEQLEEEMERVVTMLEIQCSEVAR